MEKLCLLFKEKVDITDELLEDKINTQCGNEIDLSKFHIINYHWITESREPNLDGSEYNYALSVYLRIKRPFHIRRVFKETEH